MLCWHVESLFTFFLGRYPMTCDVCGNGRLPALGTSANGSTIVSLYLATSEASDEIASARAVVLFPLSTV